MALRNREEVSPLVASGIASSEWTYSGPKEEFEVWIKETVCADFHWRVRLRDNTTNREMVASLILDGINRNSGIFAEKNTFIERV